MFHFHGLFQGVPGLLFDPKKPLLSMDGSFPPIPASCEKLLAEMGPLNRCMTSSLVWLPSPTVAQSTRASRARTRHVPRSGLRTVEGGGGDTGDSLLGEVFGSTGLVQPSAVPNRHPIGRRELALVRTGQNVPRLI